MPLSKQTIISRARSYPVEECLISSDWERGSGLVQIVLARKQPDGAICFGVYLVDKFGVRHEDVMLVKEDGEPEILTGKLAMGPWDP